MTPQPPEVDSTHAVSYFVATLVAMAFVVLEPQGFEKTPQLGELEKFSTDPVFFWGENYYLVVFFEKGDS